MAHQLLLEVPEEVYEARLETAREEGQAPEVIAAQQLTAAVRGESDDPLAKWIGALHTDVVGWADDHDRYIGEAIYASMHDTQPKHEVDG
jgi:hypothetical protein